MQILSDFPVSIHPEHQPKQSSFSPFAFSGEIAAASPVPTVGKPRDAVSISEWLFGTGPTQGWISSLIIIVVLAVFRASDLSATWHVKQICRNQGTWGTS